MDFANKLSRITEEARTPKPRFNANRLNYFFGRFKYHCEEAAKAGKSSFQLEYIEEYLDGYEQTYGATIFIIPEEKYEKYKHNTTLMGRYRNVWYGAAHVNEGTFPLDEIVHTLNKKLHQDGFKNINVDIIQKPFEFKPGRFFSATVMAKVIRVSVSW